MSGRVAAKQRQFQDLIQGAGEWAYELADGTMTIGGKPFDITSIGTHSPEHQTWLWAWVNPDFPPAAREAALAIQNLHAVTGFRVFIDPGIAASSADAEDFAALAVHQLEAIGLFRSPSPGPTLYLAVHELRNQQVPLG